MKKKLVIIISGIKRGWARKYEENQYNGDPSFVYFSFSI